MILEPFFFGLIFMWLVLFMGDGVGWALASTYRVSVQYVDDKIQGI